MAAATPTVGATQAVARALGGAAGVLVLAALWEAAPRAGLLNISFFPPLSAVLAKLAALVATAEFWGFVASTARTWALGLALATLSGVLAGLFIGLVPGARTYTHSTIEFLRPIPSVALIPGVILLFGSRYQSGVVLITYAAFWQVLLQMLYGLNDIDSVARDTARSFRFSLFGFIRHVAWPTLLPFLFTGVRLAAAMALVLAVTAEMVIGSQGIGRGIVVAQASNATAESYAYVLVAGLMGMAINLAARRLELCWLQWHPSVRNAGRAMIAFWARKLFVELALPLVLFALLYFLSAESTNFYFPPLGSVLEKFGELWLGPRFTADVIPSLQRLMAGYLLACVLGTALGVLIGSHAALRRAAEPVLEFFRAIPPVAMIPLLIMSMGFGNAMKITVIVAGAIWPILLNTVEGVKAVDAVLDETCKTYQIKGLARLRHFILPAASPQIIVGMRLGLSIGIVLMVISEMFAALDGLGSAIIYFQRSYEIPQMWSGVLMLGLFGFGLSMLFRLFEHIVLGWYYGMRNLERRN